MNGAELVEFCKEFRDGNHIWILLEDGRALDPTADQFGNYPEIYLGERLHLHV